MKPSRSNLIPLALSAAVLALVGVIYLLNRYSATGGLIDQVEWLTYDARLKLAANFNDVRNISPKLATLFIDDIALKRVNGGEKLSQTFAANTNSLESNPVEYKYKWPWPMYLHGQMIRELSAQKAIAVGYDILFAEQENSGSAPLIYTDDGFVTSENFFIQQLTNAGNVILATEGNVLPALPFLEASQGLGNISAEADHGVLRRVKPYTLVREWNPIIKDLVKPLNLLLGEAVLTNENFILIPIEKTEDDLNPAPFVVRLNPNGSMELMVDGNLNTDPEEKKLGSTDQMPFTDKKVWNLGIVLASKLMGIDLEKTRFNRSTMILTGPGGVERVIELDQEGAFYIDWGIKFDDLKEGRTPIYMGNIDEVLYNDFGRVNGETNLDENFAGKAVLVGSVGTGNNISDVGATPIESKTFLVIKHLNVANSILNGKFISRVPFLLGLSIILILGIVSATLTWKTRVVTASMSICFLALAYIATAVLLFVNDRYWLDMFMPVGGGLILPHFTLVSYRVMFEQKEQRRVKGIFTKIVSPEVVQELLGSNDLSLGGVRRRITVFFADVRGFTEFCDSAQANAEEYVRKNNLSEDEAKKVFDQTAAENLATVNLYLGIISNMVKKHDGTLDKYIGDCVMAFWGAPVPNEQHALYCVRAAIDAQRGIYTANLERFAENERRKKDNIARAAAGKPPLPLLSLLMLGSGINTGYAVVGLMGSDANIVNYTAFGPEVNLASRLESVSGHGRIVIGEKTFLDIKRDDPTLAANIIELPQTILKGVRHPVKIYEVPWKVQNPYFTSAGSSEKFPAIASNPHELAAPMATPTIAAIPETFAFTLPKT